MKNYEAIEYRPRWGRCETGARVLIRETIFPVEFPLTIDTIEFPGSPELLADFAERVSLQRLVIAARAQPSFRPLLERCDQAIPLCRTAIARVLVASLGALVATYLGDHADALERALRVADHYDETLAPQEQAHAAAALHRALGNAFLGMGDAEHALEEYAAGAAACDVSDDAWEHSVALFNLGEALVGLGDPERAGHYFEQALEAKSRLEDPWGLSYTHAALAKLHATVDEPELALEEARRAFALAKKTGDMKLRSTVYRTMGEVLHTLGHTGEARQHLEVALETATQVGAGPELAAARAALTQLHAARYGGGRGGLSSSS